MCKNDLQNEVDLVTHSLVQQRVTTLNNMSDTMPGGEDIKLDEAKLQRWQNSEMAIWETFLWRCQWPPGIAKTTQRGERRGGKGRAGGPGQNLGEGSFPGNQVRSMWQRQKDSCQSKGRRPNIWSTGST